VILVGCHRQKRKDKKRWNVSQSGNSASAFRHVLRKNTYIFQSKLKKDWNIYKGLGQRVVRSEDSFAKKTRKIIYITYI
jgi:hypothetical protein